MDECADRVGAGCCLSLLDDRPSGAVTSYCLAANASVYTLTLEDHLGKAKDLLEGRKNSKMSEWLLYTESVIFICLLAPPSGRVLPDKMVLQAAPENR